MSTEERIEQLENALQRLVNLATFCVPLGTKGWIEAIPQAQSVLRGESVTKPLREENRQLHKDVAVLMGEDRVLMAVVEAHFSHLGDADYHSEREEYGSSSASSANAQALEKLLEAHHVAMEDDDEEGGEIIHILREGKEWRS